MFLDNGYTKEEWKVVTESRKILHLPELRVSCTAVRVPVFVSHSEAVHVETRDPITPAEARALFAGVKGVVVQDDPAANEYPLAETPPARTTCSSGRVRQDPSIDGNRGLAFWVVSRQPAQGRGVERGRDRRGADRARLGPAASRAATRGRRRRPTRARRSGTGRGVRGTARVTRDERRVALEAIASRGPRLHPLPPARGPDASAVPGEGEPDTEVVFVGEGPGFNEDREGRPFVGRAGGLLVQLLGSIGWQRDDVFITNVVKCRPPDNRDPQPDEIAACAPYLRRQLEALDPAVVVTLGRYSMGTFMPGARIGQVHGTTRADRSRARAARRARVRDVPPGGRAAHAGARARELRGHRARARTCCSGPASAARRPRRPPPSAADRAATRAVAAAAAPRRARAPPLPTTPPRRRVAVEPASDDASQLTLF